jgi:hypothetical protein
MNEVTSVLARELRVISESLGRLAAALTDPDFPTPSKSGKRTLTPARRRALEQHGKYLNLLSRLTPKAKASVQTRRQQKGVAAAIALARRLNK